MTVLSDLIIRREVADALGATHELEAIRLAISEIQRLSQFVCASCDDAPRECGEWCRECVQLHTGRTVAEWQNITFATE